MHAYQTLDDVRSTLAPLADDDLTKRALAMVDAAAALTPTGTAKAWFTARHGRHVDTMQAGPMGIWAPMSREVDASKATYVRLDGSRRDYAKLRVLGTSPDTLAVATDDEVIVYQVTTTVTTRTVKGKQ